MTTPELDDYRWLVNDAASWLRDAAECSAPLASLVPALRRNLSEARTHLVLEQVALRRRAQEKFSQAQRMFFTAQGLEQATDEALARYKSRRFSRDVPVADFCCGIGGDLLALAERGPVIGVDRDEVCAILATANCVPLGVADARVLVADAQEFLFDGVTAWHVDPDRRPHGHRTSQPDFYEPGPEVVDAWRTRCSVGAVKLAPAAVVPESWRDECELEWIASRGGCRQQVAWFGELARQTGQRSATVVTAGGESLRTVVGQGDAPISLAPAVGRYLFEPNPAVLAAGLAGSLAAEHHLAALAVEAGYLTGDAPVDDAALAAFEVTDVLSFDTKRLKTLLRDRGIGRLEVKKRGVDIDPAQVQRTLRVPGDHSATLLVARLGKKVVAILAQRVSSSSAAGA